MDVNSVKCRYITIVDSQALPRLGFARVTRYSRGFLQSRLNSSLHDVSTAIGIIIGDFKRAVEEEQLSVPYPIPTGIRKAYTM